MSVDSLAEVIPFERFLECRERRRRIAVSTGTVVVPDKLMWGRAPPGINPAAKAAVLEGDPTQPGYFVVRLRMPDGTGVRLKVRSVVALLPICATAIIEPQMLERFPELRSRVHGFLARFAKRGVASIRLVL